MILSLIFILVFLLFPVLLWGYGTIYLSENIWNRNRFLFGMIGGAIAVGVIAIFGKSGLIGTLPNKILSFTGIFLIIGSVVWWVTRNGSPFIRGFLRKALLLHTVIFCAVFTLSLIFRQILPTSNSFLVFLSSMGGLLLAASIEEGVKHVSTLGLTAKEFRFTRRDFLLFTFFVTLGFATFENAIYLFAQIGHGPWSVFLIGASRIIFSLTIHVFAAGICVMMWWKALSYKFFSLKYIAYFLFGYVAATAVHGIYNIILERSYIVPLIVLTAIGYFSVTQWLIGDDES